MNDDRIRALARALALRASRRRLTSGMAATALAALALAERLPEVATAKKRKKRKKDGQKRRKKKPCQGSTTRCGKVCVDTSTDRTHCGACREACTTAQDCCNGVCRDRWSFVGAIHGRVPYGVSVAPDGSTVWVSELWDGKVTVREGDAVTSFGSNGDGPDQLTYPHGLCTSPDGSMVWIADTLNHRISVWSLVDGTWMPHTTFGSSGDGPDHLSQPEDVFASADGQTIWVADTLNNRISIWTRSGNTWTHAESFGSWGHGPDQFKSPSSIAVAEDGQTIWVADTLNYRISIWAKSNGSWAPAERFGSEGIGPSQFSHPSGIAVSADGQRALIADAVSGRVMLWGRREKAWIPETEVERSEDPVTRGPRDVALSADGKTAWVLDSDRNLVSIWQEQGCAE